MNSGRIKVAFYSLSTLYMVSNLQVSCGGQPIDGIAGNWIEANDAVTKCLDQGINEYGWVRLLLNSTCLC